MLKLLGVGHEEALEKKRKQARERMRRWRAKNPDKVRQYYERNGDRLREAARLRYAAAPEKQRAAERRYIAKYPEKDRERHRRWYKDNRAKRLAADREWREQNPEKAAAKAARHRARKLGAIVGDPKAIEAREIEIRKSRWCEACKAKVDDLHVDHIIPLSKGGAHSVENLQGLCARHNLEKGARLIETA